jgi:hypothetical protein
MVQGIQSIYEELLDPARRRALGGAASRLRPYLRRKPRPIAERTGA